MTEKQQLTKQGKKIKRPDMIGNSWNLKNRFESNKRISQKIQKLIMGFGILLILIHEISAYSLSFPMMNLWDLFVEQIFGSFGVAIAFICLIFFVVLMLGGISYYTVIIFMIYFILAMTIGYGYPLITASIAIFGTMYAIYQTFKWFDNR